MLLRVWAVVSRAPARMVEVSSLIRMSVFSGGGRTCELSRSWTTVRGNLSLPDSISCRMNWTSSTVPYRLGGDELSGATCFGGIMGGKVGAV